MIQSSSVSLVYVCQRARELILLLGTVHEQAANSCPPDYRTREALYADNLLVILRYGKHRIHFNCQLVEFVHLFWSIKDWSLKYTLFTVTFTDIWESLVRITTLISMTVTYR